MIVHNYKHSKHIKFAIKSLIVLFMFFSTMFFSNPIIYAEDGVTYGDVKEDNPPLDRKKWKNLPNTPVTVGVLNATDKKICYSNCSFKSAKDTCGNTDGYCGIGTCFINDGVPYSAWRDDMDESSLYCKGHHIPRPLDFNLLIESDWSDPKPSAEDLKEKARNAKWDTIGDWESKGGPEKGKEISRVKTKEEEVRRTVIGYEKQGSKVVKKIEVEKKITYDVTYEATQMYARTCEKNKTYTQERTSGKVLYHESHCTACTAFMQWARSGWHQERKVTYHATRVDTKTEPTTPMHEEVSEDLCIYEYEEFELPPAPELEPTFSGSINAYANPQGDASTTVTNHGNPFTFTMNYIVHQKKTESIIGCETTVTNTHKTITWPLESHYDEGSQCWILSNTEATGINDTRGDSGEWGSVTYETWSEAYITVNVASPNGTFSMIGYTVDGAWYEGPAESSTHSGSFSDNKTRSDVGFSKDLYAHWCSEPGQLYAMPNSADGTVDSCYAGSYNGSKDVTMVQDATGPTEYASNATKIAFDNKDKDYTFGTPDTQNLTVHYSSDGGTVDYDSSETDVKFEKWIATEEYEDDYMRFSGSSLTGILGCGRGESLFHGEFEDGESPTYKFNDNRGNWCDDNKGAMRNSLAKAQYEGSWRIQLPNAYKTGYLFKGWYNGDTYIGDAGTVIDTADWVRSYNTTGSIPDISSDLKANKYDQLCDMTLTPQWEPIQYKVLYVMNIPSDTDAVTTYGSSIQSHSLVNAGNVFAITGVENHHSLVSDGSDAGGRTGNYGTSADTESDYAYIGKSTYTYDGGNWDLDPLEITTNDYLFTGWTYTDIIWNGWGGLQTGVSFGTRYGNGVADCYNTGNDYTLTTLTMDANIVQNVENNLPDTAGDAPYTSAYKVQKKSARDLLSENLGETLNAPQSDCTNGSMGGQASGLNNQTSSQPYVYIVMTANWTPDVTVRDLKLRYNSNNNANQSYTTDISNIMTDYVNLLTINDSSLSGFSNSSSLPAALTSANTSAGDTSDDGSYDYNETSDTFVVEKNNPKIYSFTDTRGDSNGRKGFYSFQGWSTWKFATWRDAIDLNKKDTDTSELQDNGSRGIGHDGSTINSSFKANSLTLRKYNDVQRTKRIGDLLYRGEVTYLPHCSYNGSWTDMTTGNMVSPSTNGNYQYATSQNLWNSYRWRWTQGTSGHYHIPLEYITKRDGVIDLYAIWDSYPTSLISNIYCYKKDIETLTPAYLFSKVIAYDYEDFFNQSNNAIGGTAAGNVDWNTVASASPYMNNAKASTCPTGDYTYTYNLASNSAYMGGKFTATLVGYNYNSFVNAYYMDDVASVSMTYKFVDSAGNTTYKTAWIYIIDEEDTDRPDDPNGGRNPGGNNNDASGYTDNVRYSLTRFISKDAYLGNIKDVNGNKPSPYFDSNGNYILNSANEQYGSLLKRSKWYMNSSYKNELLDAFDRLETIGNSSLELKLDNLSSLPKLRLFKAEWSGDYHPQYEPDPESTIIDNSGQWVYNWHKILSKTKGVYQLDFDDILKTKQYAGSLDSNGDKTARVGVGNYTSDNTLSKYVSDILSKAGILRYPDGSTVDGRIRD